MVAKAAAEAKSLIPPGYGDIRTTTLTAEVKPESNTFNFTLSDAEAPQSRPRRRCPVRVREHAGSKNSDHTRLSRRRHGWTWAIQITPSLEDRQSADGRVHDSCFDERAPLAAAGEGTARPLRSGDLAGFRVSHLRSKKRTRRRQRNSEAR